MNAALSPSPNAFDATSADFEQTVMQKSMSTPVLVDFWADWCGPCKQLKPVLEKLAAEFNGGFLLARVDSDAETQLAGLFGIRSLPTVMLLKDGRPVDGFMGAVPESAIRQFLAQHGVLPAAAAAPEPMVDLLDPADRIAALRDAIAAEPDKEELKLDLAVELAKIGATEEALLLVDHLSAKHASDDRTKKVRATLGFAAALKDAPSMQELEHRLSADDGDIAARHLLGVRCLVEGNAEAALIQFLEILRRDRSWREGLAKRLLIDAFSLIEDAELIGAYRRKMASLLF